MSRRERAESPAHLKSQFANSDFAEASPTTAANTDEWGQACQGSHNLQIVIMSGLVDSVGVANRGAESHNLQIVISPREDERYARGQSGRQTARQEA